MPNEIAILAGRILESRHRGDRRPLQELVNEVIADVPTNIKTEAFQRAVTLRFLREGRKEALVDRTNQLILPLPFAAFPGGRNSYRTGPLVRLHREGQSDFVSPRVATGDEIDRASRWNTLQRKRALVEAQEDEAHNAGHTAELRLLGFDPSTQTVDEMHSQGDPRICVLCGSGVIAGDPFEEEHETPVSKLNGQPTRIGWAHRSCNRSKGADAVAHETIAP
jgi:hypothetical protein